MNTPERLHIPVLLEEVALQLAVQPGDRILDCTLGAAGHAVRLAEAAGPQGLLIGLDVDEAAIQHATARLSATPCPFRVFHSNFRRADEVLRQVNIPNIDVILADLGASSVQFDDADRGFSFQQDGPLDMRMDTRLGQSAADLVNRLGETELANLIYQHSQERLSRRIARAICRHRHSHRITTTAELARIVTQAAASATRGRWRIHPATRTFQALRIAVNDELASLHTFTARLPDLLAAGGRVGIISFHSLEDRIIKRHFAEMARQGAYQIRTKKPITASERERAANVRSRSAKLRVATRL